MKCNFFQSVCTIASLEDLRKYQPPDPCAKGRYASLERLVERYKGKLAIGVHVNDVMSVPRNLMGYENWLMTLAAEPDLVRALGATYHSGSVLDVPIEPDAIIECTGVGSVIADSIQKIGSGGTVCLTGVGGGGLSGYAVADTAAKVVLKNNVLVGSVNANKRHWYKASQALAQADRAWLSRLITRRVKPEDFQTALDRKPDDIKVVIQFSEV